MASPSNFPGAYLKVERAYQHIDELRSLVQPLSPDLFSVDWRDEQSRPTFTMIRIDFGGSNPEFAQRELVYVPKKPISQTLALVIGDALHNLRSALDHAATTVVRHAREDASYVTFPFHEEGKKLIPSDSSGLRQIQKALPGADVVDFFQGTIKPCRDGNYKLWVITKLDKIDKHNFIIPTVTVADINSGTFTAIPSGLTISGNIVRSDANKEVVLSIPDQLGAIPRRDKGS